jgi:hypothetical protein
VPRCLRGGFSDLKLHQRPVLRFPLHFFEAGFAEDARDAGPDEWRGQLLAGLMRVAFEKLSTMFLCQFDRTFQQSETHAFATVFFGNEETSHTPDAWTLQSREEAAIEQNDKLRFRRDRAPANGFIAEVSEHSERHAGSHEFAQSFAITLTFIGRKLFPGAAKSHAPAASTGAAFSEKRSDIIPVRWRDGFNAQL